MTCARLSLALVLALCAGPVGAEHAQIGTDKFERAQFTIQGPHAGCLGGNHLHATNLNIITSTDGLVTYFDFNSAACGYSGTLGFPAAIAGGDFAALAGPNFVPDPPAAAVATVSATPATSDAQLANVQFQGARDFEATANGSLVGEGENQFTIPSLNLESQVVFDPIDPSKTLDDLDLEEKLLDERVELLGDARRGLERELSEVVERRISIEHRLRLIEENVADGIFRQSTTKEEITLLAEGEKIEERFDQIKTELSENIAQIMKIGERLGEVHRDQSRRTFGEELNPSRVTQGNEIRGGTGLFQQNALE